MIAKNMPYSATLSALTARKGSAFPAMMPQAVPTAQAGAANRIAGSGNGDAEQLVRHIISDDQTVEKGRSWGELLRQCTAHEQISGIRDQRNDRYLQIGCLSSHQGKGSIFSGGSIIQKTGKESLQRSETSVSCSNSQGEGYGEISQRDGKTVPHAVAEYFSAEFIIHNYNPHLSVRRL